MKKLRTAALSFFLIFMMATMALAATKSYTEIGLNKSSANVWNGGYSVSRSKNYSYVNLRLNSLYPLENISDAYTKVKACVKNESGTQISSIKTVTEGAGDISFTLYEGYLNLSSVEFYIKNYYYNKYLLANITCYGN